MPRPTPDDSLAATTGYPRASSSGWALATTRGCPAHASMDASLGMSPKAATSLAELGERRASAAGLIMWLVPLVGVAAATLLVVGLNQRLQEYR